MAGQRQPIELVVKRGKKHLTKAEIAERTASEVHPCTDDISAPKYLTKTQKQTFNEIAKKLQKINVMGETDADALARYVTAQDLYEKITKKLRREINNPDSYELEQLAKLQDRYFKQAQTMASSLGLTITSRCRIALPPDDEKPKENKFTAKFGKAESMG